MRWKKLGKIFNVANPISWMNSHSTNPTPFHLGNNNFRIFFSTRDNDNKSNVGYFDLNIESLIVDNISSVPSLIHGGRGEIDESGIAIGCFLHEKQNIAMYYMAWQTPENAHWRGDIAKAILNSDRITMSKPADNLVLGINNEDRLSLSYPFVLYEENIYHMWYGSTESWDCGNGEMLHVIKYASSNDLKTWKHHGCCIKPTLGISQAFSRPVVVKFGNGWHMWYSYRGNKDKYKIGYAFSNDRINWVVYNNQCNVVPLGTIDDWDSEMVCYPYVFKHNNKLFMLYNGNGYGKTGIGLAVTEE